MALTFPLIHTVQVARLQPGGKDSFGTPLPATRASFEDLKVAGWAVEKTEEKQGDSVLRLVDTLTLYSPEELPPDTHIRLPNGTQWAVDGHAQDYRNGPWWDPGLVAHTCTYVSG